MVLPTGKGMMLSHLISKEKRTFGLLTKLVFVVIQFNTSYSKSINMLFAGCLEQ